MSDNSHSTQGAETHVTGADAALKYAQPSRWVRLVDHMKRNWQIYLMLAPTIIWLLLFLYKPMYGLQIAFKDYSIFRGILNSPWVGFEHFETLFGSEQFLRAIKNTVAVSVLSLLVGFPVPILLALMFNEIINQTFKKTAQTIVYLPHFISAVIISGIVIAALSPSSGIFNSIIEFFGGEPIYFLTKPEWFRPIFIGTGIWQEAGFSSIVYLAAIAGVSPTLYESAVVDGASRWQMMWKITLPTILPTIIIMLIIRIGNLLEVSFEMIILLYNERPATYETSDVINTWIYRQGLVGGQYDLAAAAGLFNAIIAFVLVITANSLARRYSKTSLW